MDSTRFIRCQGTAAAGGSKLPLMHRMMEDIFRFANLNLYFRYGRSRLRGDDDLLDVVDRIYDCDEGEPEEHIHQSEYESRLSIVARIHSELRNAGICTICGNGATSLAKKLTVFLKSHEQSLRIAMVTISQYPNLEEIQSDISQQIQQEKIDDCIIVLDGFWWKLSNDDFKAIGILSPRKSFCIVFTSRNEDMCKKIGSGYVYHIDFLEDEEALDLFKEQAAKTVVYLGLRETARKIVEECDGFRFSILTIASSLKDQPADIWEASLTRLQKKPNDLDRNQILINRK